MFSTADSHYSNINNYILSGIESLTENVHMEK